MRTKKQWNTKQGSNDYYCTPKQNTRDKKDKSQTKLTTIKYKTLNRYKNTIKITTFSHNKIQQSLKIGNRIPMKHESNKKKQNKTPKITRVSTIQNNIKKISQPNNKKKCKNNRQNTK